MVSVNFDYNLCCSCGLFGWICLHLYVEKYCLCHLTLLSTGGNCARSCAKKIVEGVFFVSLPVIHVSLQCISVIIFPPAFNTDLFRVI